MTWLVDDPTRRSALLGLVLTNKEDVVGDEKLDGKPEELWSLKGGGRLKRATDKVRSDLCDQTCVLDKFC